MPTQHPDMTSSPLGRSEDDLRAALVSLEELAPNSGSVLRPRPRRHRRTLPRRRVVAVAACVLAGAAAVVELSSTPATTPGRTATQRPSLRRAILTAFESASGMVLESRATIMEKGGVAGHSESWLGPTLPRPGTTARYRYMYMTVGGQPVSELAELYTARRPDFSALGEGFTGIDGVTRRLTTVDYRQRTWSSRATRQDAFVSLADDPALLRHEVARGLWRVAGHVRIDGRSALELRWKPVPVTQLHRTLWVDAHTYMPIRQRIQLGSGPNGAFYGITANYRLLAPTPANLAKLRPVIPAGFTETHGPHGAVPVPVSPFL